MRWRTAFAGALALLAASAIARPGVPASRLSRLNRGISLGAYRYRGQAAIPPELARSLWHAGFRHVRLPIDPATLFDEASPGTLKPDGLVALNRTLDLLMKQGFAVSVDLHDPDKRVWNEPAMGDAFVTFWGALAGQLARRSPERLFMEVANEPISDDPAHWAALQARCLAAMRRAAPRHTFIASPNMCISKGNWNVPEVLKTFRPVRDPNVVYTFHYYNPFFFTHQGATWGWDGVKGLSGIPYPSDPESVAAVAERLSEPQKGYIIQYGKERWNAARIRQDLRQYVDWGRRYKVPVYCGEFGAYRDAPAEARMRWLRDARCALEAAKVPWTIWDYESLFGVTNGRNATLDRPALAALGLKP